MDSGPFWGLLNTDYNACQKNWWYVYLFGDQSRLSRICSSPSIASEPIAKMCSWLCQCVCRTNLLYINTLVPWDSEVVCYAVR